MIVIRISAAMLAIFNLASCITNATHTDGGSEFATKMVAGCIRTEGQQGAARCDCSARILETLLNDEEKAFMIATMDDDPEIRRQAVDDLGFTTDQMISMIRHLSSFESRVKDACPA
jgi:hypothetical protein